MKKCFAAILAIIMLFSLAACGGKDKGSDEGGDKAETVVLDEYSAVFKGYTFTKDDEGNDAIVLTYDFKNGSKTEQSFAWAFLYEATQAGEALGSPGFDENYEPITANYEEEVQPGKSLEVKFALTLVNTTDDVTITFSDFYYHEYIQTIKLSDSGGSLKPIDDPKEPETQLTELQQWWNGDWYGWWAVSMPGGFYKEDGWDGMYWDCCAELDIDAKGIGTLKMWDEDLPKDDPLAEIDLSVSRDYGSGDMGAAYSEGGYFLDMQLGHTDIIIDPSLCDYENFIVINLFYEDEQGDFSLHLYLRPWGQDWTDVSDADNTMPYEDMLPNYYYDWYLPAIENGADMPDAIGGGDTLAYG